MDGDPEIILQTDEEGNGYKRLCGADDNARYNRGRVGMDHLSQRDLDAGYTDEDLLTGGKKVIVLYS